MKFLLKLVTYLFHPLGIPFWGSVLYFLLTPRFFPSNIVQAKILAIIILTIFIPIIFLFLLKNLGIIKSIQLQELKDRKLPLLFFSLILATVINFILEDYSATALYYFFDGMLLSSIIAGIFVFYKKSISLHAMGISALTFFMASFSLFYHLNLILILAALSFCTGVVCFSRLALQKQHGQAILIGLISGALPQLIFLSIEFYILYKI